MKHHRKRASILLQQCIHHGHSPVYSYRRVYQTNDATNVHCCSLFLGNKVEGDTGEKNDENDGASFARAFCSHKFFAVEFYVISVLNGYRFTQLAWRTAALSTLLLLLLLWLSLPTSKHIQCELCRCSRCLMVS